MSWIILTTLAVSSRAMYSLASRLLSMHIKVSPNTQAILYTGIATILSVLIIPFLGGLSFPTLSSAWVIILLMMLSQGVGNVLYFKGQEQLDAGTTQIAFSSIVIWGVLLSIIFLQSHFSLFQFVGILLLIVAIILTQYKKQGNLNELAQGVM